MQWRIAPFFFPNQFRLSRALRCGAMAATSCSRVPIVRPMSAAEIRIAPKKPESFDAVIAVTQPPILWPARTIRRVSIPRAAALDGAQIL